MEKVFKVVIKTAEGDEKIHLKHFIDVVYPCFDQFKQKIVIRFPYLNGKNIKIFWIDDDNDQVNILNEEDFRVFVEQSGISKDKLYVVEKNGEPKPVFVPTTEPKIPVVAGPSTSNQSSPRRDGQTKPMRSVHPEHVKVVCDNCEGKIIGFRYKCALCPDFDLCMDCEAKMEHKEHAMIRFYLPAEYMDWKKYKFEKLDKAFRRRCGRENDFSDGEKCGKKKDKRRHSHHHHEKKNNENCNIWVNMMKQFHDLANGENGIFVDETGENVPQFGRGPPFGRNPPVWLDYLNGFSNHTVPTAPPPTNQTNNDTNPNVDNNSSNFGNQMPSSSSSENKKKDDAETTQSKPEAQNPPNPGYPVIDVFGILNGLAKPLGVNIVRLTSEPQSTRKNEQPKNDTTTETEEKKHDNSNDEKNSRETSQERVIETPLTTSNESVNEIPLQPEKISPKNDEINSINVEQTKQQQQHCEAKLTDDVDDSSSDKEWDVIDDENSLENAEKRKLIPQENKLENPFDSCSSATVVDELMSFNSNLGAASPPLSNGGGGSSSSKNGVESPTPSTPQKSASETNFKKLSDDLKEHIQAEQNRGNQEIFATDPRINTAVRSMIAMGFSNEGGWLTQLLYSVNGDISRAIDLMQPIQH